MGCDRKIGPFDCCSVVEGDCLELMKQLPDGCVDAVITDPPYGMNSTSATMVGGKSSRWSLPTAKSAWSGEPLAWDDEAPPIVSTFPDKFNQCIIWGGNFFDLPRERGWLVWNKIIRNFSSSVCELAWTNLDVPIDAFDCSHGELASEGKVHPTQKPLGLMIWCVEKTEGTILDPFCGSGTTLVAAKKLGRHFLGFEISPEYCEIARDRLARIEAQPNLFEPKPEQLQLGGGE